MVGSFIYRMENMIGIFFLISFEYYKSEINYQFINNFFSLSEIKS